MGHLVPIREPQVAVGHWEIEYLKNIRTLAVLITGRGDTQHLVRGGLVGIPCGTVRQDSFNNWKD